MYGLHGIERFQNAMQMDFEFCRGNGGSCSRQIARQDLPTDVNDDDRDRQGLPREFQLP
jgi:hypothetical protein